MREKELRLALVCYGGVSLAVYMHGITKEVWKLTRASMRRKLPPATEVPPARDTEVVYCELLELLRPHADIRVLTDIIAGASAGGINGIFLAQAIARGSDLEALRELWLAGADSDRLLNAEGAASRTSKWWAMPLIWFARRRGLVMEDMPEPAARAEVGHKLSRLMRSRWFRPPFSGKIFSAMLYDALVAMEKGERTPPLLPAEQPLDLFVTVTDFRGAPEVLRLHSPPSIVEYEHRLIIGFHSASNGSDGRRSLGDPAELAFAARATASFPGAFPPARVGEIDTVVADRAAPWPTRHAFLARLFPGHPAPESVTLIDGSVLNNRPFGPAIDALAQRPAHREVDRRFVYVDPKPGMHAEPSARDNGKLPGFFATILRSLADIPRQQPINDNLAAIEALSARVRRLRYVIEGMTPDVDAAIERATGGRLFMFRLNARRLADWRSRTQTVAARESGFAYAAYGQLKVAQIVEAVAAMLTAIGGGEPRAVRAAVWTEISARGLDHPAQAITRGGAVSDYVVFLRSFDLDFRIRRLRFVLRRLNAIAETLDDGSERRALEAFKAALYGLLGPLIRRRQPEFYAAIAETAADAIHQPAAAMSAFAAAMDLRGVDTDAEAQLVDMFGMALPTPVRRALLRAYLGFPFYDIALLPLLQGESFDEFDEIKVDRMSPEDALSLRRCGGATLKGAQFNAFGAFFSRAYREHDYLWGRLHGADRMIDIVISALPDPGVIAVNDIAALKHRAFRAIVEAERPYLTVIPDLFEALDAELAGPPA